jgi:hypothetical protein
MRAHERPSRYFQPLLKKYFTWFCGETRYD